MKNNEIKNHFLYVFQQKLIKLIFTRYTFEYLTVKQNNKHIPKSFSDVTLKRTKKSRFAILHKPAFEINSLITG